MPYMPSKEKVPAGETAAYLRDHPVFELGHMAAKLGLPGGRRAAHERAKYHAGRGRLKRVARGIYAVVPPNVDAEAFDPDKFLVAHSARPDGVFCYHAALELLGAAQSAWTDCTVFASNRRAPIKFGNATIRFLLPPSSLDVAPDGFGESVVHRVGASLRTTGPERTLVEGFRRLQHVGGLEELWTSAAAFGVLDLDLVVKVLERYDEQLLWGATGWFLDEHRERLFVPQELLDALHKRRPRSPRYVVRGARGGTLNARWNLILPPSVTAGWEGQGG